MEQFLLLIIVVLILAVVVIVHLARVIFRFSHPYSAIGAPPIHAASSSRNNSGFGSFLIVILVVGLAYLCIPLSEEKIQKGTQNQDSTNQKQDNLRHVSDQTYFPKEEVIPNDNFKERSLRVKNKETHYLDKPAENWEIDRYNMSPENALPSTFFAIQLYAFNSEVNAKETAEKLSASYDRLFIIYLPNEPSSFKLVIAPFNNREAARHYHHRYQLDGYVRLIDRN